MTTIHDRSDPALGRLREYQRTGIRFLIDRNAALLADEMGLGKTVQSILAIRILLRAPDANRVLIVTPAATRLNWEREFETWAPELIVRRVIGNQADRWATYALPIPIVIASYEQIRTDYLMMRPDDPFDLVVADEVQRIKNRHSETSLACRALPRRRTWALSGTPLENSVEELVSVWRFIKKDVVAKGATKAQLHSAVQPYFLRRKKRDVLEELPPIIYQDLRLELGPVQRATYDDSWYSRREF